MKGFVLTFDEFDMILHLLAEVLESLFEQVRKEQQTRALDHRMIHENYQSSGQSRHHINGQTIVDENPSTDVPGRNAMRRGQRRKVEEPIRITSR